MTCDALERAAAPPPRTLTVPPPPPQQGPGAQPPPAAALVRPPVGDLATRPRVFTTLNGADRRNARSVRFAAHLPALDHASAYANSGDAPTPAFLGDNKRTPALGNANAGANASADANHANDANDAATPAAPDDSGPDATANTDTSNANDAGTAATPAAPDDSGPDAAGDFTSASVFVVCLHGAVLARSGGIWRDFGDRRAGIETPRRQPSAASRVRSGSRRAQVEVAPDQPVWVVRAGLRHAVFVATMSETVRRGLDFYDSLPSVAPRRLRRLWQLL